MKLKYIYLVLLCFTNHQEGNKMKKEAVKKITINAMGIALFVVLSLCLQIQIFDGFYLCLGYVVMTFYCYCIGITSGTLVGTLGVLIYCLLISGLRGMPGWALGNLFLGIVLGAGFKRIKQLKKTFAKNCILVSYIIISTAIAMLFIKSGVECILYSQPFWLRSVKNIYAFVADAFVIIISLPICKLVELKVSKTLNK